LANVSEETARGKMHGVVVSEVAPSSQAMRSGLRKGDIIVQANRKPVSDINSLKKVIDPKGALLLNIQRRGGALFLLLR
jgi:S1-C subfamily serine protease